MFLCVGTASIHGQLHIYQCKKKSLESDVVTKIVSAQVD